MLKDEMADVKLYYRATITKTAWYWYKYRHEDEWNRIVNLVINPHSCGHLILEKDKIPLEKKDSLFNKWFWKNWIFTHVEG
jgi:hypothetical protein